MPSQAGREGLVGIERLRLENAVDQYLNWAAEIQVALEHAEEDSAELRTQLTRIQTEFRAALQSKAAELASLRRQDCDQPLLATEN